VQCTDGGGNILVAVIKINLNPNTKLGIKVKTAFTPNGDHVNDHWNIDNISFHPRAKVVIVNSEGNVVFSSVGYEKPWDGTHNGRPLPMGTYYYTIELSNSQKHQGFVMIIK
jgi:large repetitive protein